jgi:hypothetical protein
VFDPLSDAAFVDLSSAAAVSDEERKLRVRFFKDEIKDVAATAKEGRPIYKSVEMVEIKIPGDKDNVVVRRVTAMDCERFPGAYAKFRRGDAVQVVGTPLRNWGLMEPADARGYEDAGILTVEQLAGLSDATCQKHRGSLADRQKARDFLEMAKGLAPVAAARAETEALRAQVEALREQIAALGGKVQDAPPVKRRGRPPGTKNKHHEPQETA